MTSQPALRASHLSNQVAPKEVLSPHHFYWILFGSSIVVAQTCVYMLRLLLGVLLLPPSVSAMFSMEQVPR